MIAVVDAATINHGLSAYRNGKCRCEVCKEAVRIDTNARRAKDPVVEVRHGFASSYLNHNCRCDECTDAWRQDCARRRKNRIGTPPPRHGASGYSNYGCRCVDCCAGRLKQEQARSAKNKEIERLLEKAKT